MRRILEMVAAAACLGMCMGCGFGRIVGTAKVKGSLDPKKHYALILTVSKAQYAPGEAIPAAVSLVGIDVPTSQANFFGELHTEIDVKGLALGRNMGEMRQYEFGGQKAKNTPTTREFDFCEQLPKTLSDTLVVAKVVGDVTFFPPRGSQFPPIEEYSKRLKIESNEVRFVIRKPDKPAEAPRP